MPFDELRPEIAARQKLIEALRRQPSCSRSKDGFLWNFGTWFDPTHHCGTMGCAAGLAKFIGFDLDFSIGAFGAPWKHPIKKLGRMIGLSKEDALKIFCMIEFYGEESSSCVTPSMVADALERAPYDFTS